MKLSEELRQQAADSGAEVINWNFGETRIKGMYCDGMIAVSDRLGTSAEEACILAEELGHHKTASGIILNQKDPMNHKQELRGRAYAYERLIGLRGIIKAWESGCTNRYEVAELLGVTEEFLTSALNYYHEKYGKCCQFKGYVIFFEPLGVMQLN